MKFYTDTLSPQMINSTEFEFGDSKNLVILLYHNDADKQVRVN